MPHKPVLNTTSIVPQLLYIDSACKDELVESSPVRHISLPQTSYVGCDETKRANGDWNSDLHVSSLPWSIIIVGWVLSEKAEQGLVV